MVELLIFVKMYSRTNPPFTGICACAALDVISKALRLKSGDCNPFVSHLGGRLQCNIRAYGSEVHHILYECVEVFFCE